MGIFCNESNNTIPQTVSRTCCAISWSHPWFIQLLLRIVLILLPTWISHHLKHVQILELAESLFELLLGLLELFALVEKLAESFTLLDAFNTGYCLDRLEV